MVEIVPEQILLDQKITDLGEALRNVPGVAQSDGFGGTNDDFFLRGFRRNTVYRDGLRRRSNFKTNPTNVERIEVIKGPASIGFGQVEPGGLVNVVTKRPLEETRLNTEFRTGRFDDRLALVDWSQRVTDGFAFRLNASAERSDTFRDFTEVERDALALSTRHDLGEATRLDLSLEYREESRPLDRGTVAVPTPDGGRTVVPVPRSRRLGEPFEAFDTTFTFAQLDLVHAFGERWELRVAAALEQSDSDDVQVRPRAILVFDEDAPIENGFFTGPAQPEPFYDEPTDRVFLARRVDGSQDREIDARYVNAILTGAFETGGIGHELAFQVDYRDTRETRFFGLNPNSDGVELPLFDVFEPVYGTVEPTFARGFDTEAETLDRGVSIQDYVTLTDRLAVLAGLRLDVSDADGNGPLDDVDEFSPQLAVRYTLTETIAAFASYSEAFVPNVQTVVDLEGNVSTSDPFPPEESDQLEVGLKGQFLEGRLNATAALYTIDKENVVQGSGAEAELIDGQSSRGLELSIVGQPVAGANVIAGYAFTDAELPDGNRPRNVAEHTFNLWSSYEVQGGPLTGLGVGAGVFHVGDRYGDNANTWELRAYTLVDASIWYTVPWSLRGRDATRPTRIQLAGKNLTDETFFPASGFDNGQRINVGTPRAWFLSVSTVL